MILRLSAGRPTRHSKKYSPEEYKENRERILAYQREWKRKEENRIKINEQRKKHRRETRITPTIEDIERNVKLFLIGKKLDMSLRKLGPLFKSKILKQEPVHKFCKLCKKKLISNYRLYCSDDCRKKYFKKNFYQHYLKKFYKRHKKRMITDETYAIKTRLRDRLRESIRFFRKTGKIRKAEEYMDYKAIMKHLGPCPGNRKDYHIDHIVPLCSFDFSKDEEIKKAFAPENLQWLSVKENLKKGTCYNSQVGQ